MKKSLIILIALSFIFCWWPKIYAEEPSDWEKKQAESQLKLDEARLNLEREKWEYEISEKEREEFEKQFPNSFDYKRSIPTYELTGYVNDSERQNLQKVFTIMYEKGVSTIRLNISSFGGSAFDGMGIADTISSFKGKGMTILGYAFGKVASAAVPIFAACSERIAGSSTMFMVHEASIFKFFTSDSKSDIEAQKEMLDNLESRYVDVLVRNSKMGSDHWAKAIKKETWFTATTALEWGLVDRIE